MFHLNPFQWIVVPILALLCIQHLLAMARGTHWRRAGLRASLWFAAATAVLWPGITIKIANSLGIGRGTDLVLYLFIISSLGASLYFYGRILKLENAITILVRRLAMHETSSLHNHSLDK